MGVKVIADSTSYIPRPLRAELDIQVATLSSLLGGVIYREDDETDEYESFYEALAASGSFPTTSQPTVADMVALFEAPVAAGHEVVGVFISALMSGTHSTALLARDMVLEQHPGATIEVVDGRSNSMELGFAVLAAARAAAAGGSVSEVVGAAEDMIGRTRFLFAPLTLEYLRRGGRIGNASALIGTLLKIHPVLTVVDGRTDQFAKVRTHAKALDTILETFAADIAAKGGLGGVYLHHIHAKEAALAFAERIAEAAGRPVELVPIGPAVGSHVGPGTLGLVYHTNGAMHKAG